MQIDFAVPQWFALSLILPFLVGLKWWSRSRAAAAVDGIVARRLQPLLVRRIPWWTDWTGFGLQLLAILAFIVALARPQWGFHQIETSTAERNVFIAIDTSRSMLAEDLQPNRLTRARLLAQDLVRNLPADRIGVIAFAGKAFMQAPLTVDHDAVLETLAQLDVEIIPRGGTNLAGPVLLALESMREAETSMAAIVIFSDGEDLEGSKEKEKLTKEIQNSRLLIVTVGSGTTAGGIIPDPDKAGQFLKDESGQIVRTRLDASAMRELSDLSGGSYVDMSSEGSVTTVVQQALRKLESERLRAEDVRVPHERYAIPLAAGMILLLLSHLLPLLTGRSARVRLPAASPAVILLTASLLTGLGGTGRAASSGLEAYRTGAFAEAQERFTASMAKSPIALIRHHCQFGIGAAAYRGADFDTAKDAFSEALLSNDPGLQEKSHYNLANSLFEGGRLVMKAEREAAIAQWESALTHYDAALALNQSNAGAKQNREFVQTLLDKLKNEPPPPDEKKPEEDPEKNEEEKKGDEPKKDPPPQEPDKPKEEEQPPKPEEQEPGDKPKEPEKKPDSPEGNPEDSPPPPPPKEWNPAQARQILEQNAGEDLNAKPVQVVPFSSQPFKNW